MSKVKLNLRYLTVTEKVQFARQIVTAMASNPNFPNPDPPLADVGDTANALEAAFNAANVAHQSSIEKTSIQADAEVALDGILSKLANHVDSVSNGDEVKILSSGMGVKSKPAPIGELPQPMSLAATAGDMEGEIDLTWDKVYGAKSYITEYTPEPIIPTNWKSAGVSTKSNKSVSSLLSGTKYWFRVAAVGAAGQGPWSDPATKYAP